MLFSREIKRKEISRVLKIYRLCKQKRH